MAIDTSRKRNAAFIDEDGILLPQGGVFAGVDRANLVGQYYAVSAGLVITPTSGFTLPLYDEVTFTVTRNGVPVAGATWTATSAPDATPELFFPHTDGTAYWSNQNTLFGPQTITVTATDPNTLETAQSVFYILDVADEYLYPSTFQGRDITTCATSGYTDQIAIIPNLDVPSYLWTSANDGCLTSSIIQEGIVDFGSVVTLHGAGTHTAIALFITLDPLFIVDLTNIGSLSVAIETCDSLGNSIAPVASQSYPILALNYFSSPSNFPDELPGSIIWDYLTNAVGNFTFYDAVGFTSQYFKITYTLTNAYPQTDTMILPPGSGNAVLETVPLGFSALIVPCVPVASASLSGNVSSCGRFIDLSWDTLPSNASAPVVTTITHTGYLGDGITTTDTVYSGTGVSGATFYTLRPGEVGFPQSFTMTATNACGNVTVTLTVGPVFRADGYCNTAYLGTPTPSNLWLSAGSCSTVWRGS